MLKAGQRFMGAVHTLFGSGRYTWDAAWRAAQGIEPADYQEMVSGSPHAALANDTQANRGGASQAAKTFSSLVAQLQEHRPHLGYDDAWAEARREHPDIFSAMSESVKLANDNNPEHWTRLVPK